MPTRGTVLFSQGFRPFFLFAGLWAALAVPLWLLIFQGRLALPTVFDFAAWHAHEMTFGYAGAVIAGFLLTAIPNWTGRLPLIGPPLAMLFFAWLVGRVAVALSGLLGGPLTAALDLAFLAALLAVALREIVAGRNWRNLPIMLALGLLIVANGITHMKAAGILETGGMGQRLGIAVVIQLIALIGGRVIPSFTRNWLAKSGATRMPAPFAGFDKLCLLVTLVALAGWVAVPDQALTGVALLVAGALQLARLARWQGRQTLSEPLVWSLHLGFLWLPLGLLLLGASALWPTVLPATAGIHGLTSGAIGGMTLAVMTRATLGHSGRVLTADRWTAAIYLLVCLAAVLRIAASVADAAYLSLLHGSGAAWTLAFVLFVLRYGRLQVFR
ncbi:MAG: NnrS family protein [Kiloniellaceae bacterium]